VAAPTFIERVLEAVLPGEGVTLLLEREADRLDGLPDAVKVTGELKPFIDFTLTVDVPEAPT